MATHVRGRYSSFVVPGRPFCQPHPQGTECEENASLAGFDIPTMPSKNTARIGGTKAKPSAWNTDGFAVFDAAGNEHRQDIAVIIDESDCGHGVTDQNQASCDRDHTLARRGAPDRGQHRQAAGAGGQVLAAAVCYRGVADPAEIAAMPSTSPAVNEFTTITVLFYSHGEYRHCAPASMTPASMPLLTISNRGKGTGAAASAGRGDGAGTAARDGCRGECTGAPGSARKPFAALSFQQCSLPCI